MGGWRRGPGLAASVMLLALSLAGCNLPPPEPPPTQPQVTEPAVVGAPPPAPPPEPTTDALGRAIAPDAEQVGLLVPLSGRGSDIGPALRNAAEMALFEVGADGLTLMAYDTAGTAEGARTAAEAALDRGADLIIGPLFSGSVPGVASLAAARDVSVIAFTNDSTVTGGSSFVMGFLPATQVESIVDYSAGRGLSRFGVIAPRNAYGTRVVEVVRGATQRAGVRLEQSQFYDPDARDFTAVMESFESEPPLDALMIPDSGLRLRAVAALTPFHGLGETQILGTALWDGQAVGVEPALRGAWFAAPPPELRAAFEQRYARLHGEPPPRLATLAYDAMALAATLAQQSPTDPFARSELTQPSGFAGLDGIFRFRQDGRVERGLAVLEVTEDDARVIDPAPQSFAPAGI